MILIVAALMHYEDTTGLAHQLVAEALAPTDDGPEVEILRRNYAA